MTKTVPPSRGPVRVLYSFPLKLGAGRVCWTAWQHVLGLDRAGAEVTAVIGSLAKQPPAGVRVKRTLSLGRYRLPYRLLGMRRTSMLHDWLTSKWLKRNADKIDVVHVWPQAGLRTIRIARELGIPVLTERPNAHTEFAYRVVGEECDRISFSLPEGYEHKFDADCLALEEKEYDECDYILCPSDFVATTFLDKGFAPEKLRHHHYGYDKTLVWPGSQNAEEGRGLVAIYVGLCTPRKGLHYILEAWKASEAGKTGRLIVCGGFVPGYREKLGALLEQPGVEVLGHRDDIPDLMRQADVFLLSSVEEGSALVTYEARGSGCVLLVSEASGAKCRHGENALVHPVRDAKALAGHLDMIHHDRALLAKMRAASMESLDDLTWTAAGSTLLDIYRGVVKN